MVVAICLSALFSTTINATAWQQRSCVIISNVAGSRKSRHFAPFLGHFTPILPSHRLCERQGPAAIRYPRKEVAAFALVTTVGPQPRPARSTPGEPGRAADRQAFASLSYPTDRQVLRNPHVGRPGFLVSMSTHPRTAVRRGRHAGLLLLRKSGPELTRWRDKTPRPP